MKEPSVKKNFIYSVAYQILSVLTPFITAPYVSRVLGAEGIGIVSYTSSVQTYFLMIAALGLHSYGTREISIHRNDPYRRSKLFWELYLLRGATTLIVAIGWIVLCLTSTKYQIFYSVLTINVIISIFDITWFFSGIEQFRLTVIRNSIFKVVSIVCLFVFIKSKDDLFLYVLINSITVVFNNLSLWPYLKRFLVKVNPREFEYRIHLKKSMVYFVPTIATTVYTVLDKTLLGLITGEAAQIGYYQQSERIIDLSKGVVFSAINSVVSVRNAYLFAERRFDEIHKRIETSFHFIFFMGFGCCFGIMGVAKTFVPLFFGPGYEAVIDLLYIFAPIVVIIGISNCLGAQYYTPCGKQQQSTNCLIVGSVVNLCLNLLLIPKLGSMGAAAASVTAETVIMILHVKFSDGYGTVGLLARTGVKKLIAGMIIFFVVYQMNGLPMISAIRLILQVFGGIAVYGLTLLLLGDSWTKEMCTQAIADVLKRLK